MPEAEATPQISISSINKHSSPEGKINLFRSLFKGREDVFARRWYSKATDKSGYQPVCKNEWNEEFCDKKKFKCSACPNRKLMVLTDKDIYRHLSGKDSYGRDVVGIYPMLTDETCLFLCADFDEENFLICADNDVCAWLKLNGLQNKEVVWISMLVVSDEFKHQGVGKFAVEFAIQYLKQRGYKQIKLHTTKDNLVAIGLYDKCGFSVVDKSEAEITMCKEV